MKKILFYIHGGNLNRGCEAIITSTSQLIKDVNNDSEITIATQYYESDVKRAIKNIDRYISAEHTHSKVSAERFYRFALRKFKLNNIYISSVYKNTIREVKKTDICFIIGGDTYFRRYGMINTLYNLNSIARNNNKKNVLWCCSIEKEEIDEEMKRDLIGFDLIVARESITFNNLKSKGIIQNVVMYPDPAFIMKAEKANLPEGWKIGKTIIINTSPMISKFENKPNLILESVQSMIDYILQNTDNVVALLPHVDNDVITNTQVYEKFQDSNRVMNVEFGYTAPQLKYIISQSVMLVAARTHASIAAYSTCVPTLVIGYSVKSLGIAKDIFESEKDMVIPISELHSKEQFVEKFKLFMNKKNQIKLYLENTMPSYIARANQLSSEIEKIISERVKVTNE